MAFFMLVRVLIDQAVCATGRDCGREDASPFFTGPVAGFFAYTEGFNGSCCQGCLGGLRQFFFGFTVLFPAAASSSVASTPTPTVTTRSTSRPTPMIKVSTGACTDRVVVSRTMAMAMVTMPRRSIRIIIFVIRARGTTSPSRRGPFLHGRGARMTRIVMVRGRMRAIATPGVVVVGVGAATVWHDVHRWWVVAGFLGAVVPLQSGMVVV